jgi:chaperonin cofactor prefoldin
MKMKNNPPRKDDVFTGTQVGVLVEDLRSQFRSFNEKIDIIDNRLDTLDKKFDILDTKVDTLDIKVSILGKRVDSLDKKVDSLDKKVDSLDKKVEGVCVNQAWTLERVTLIELTQRKTLTTLEGHGIRFS